MTSRDAGLIVVAVAALAAVWWTMRPDPPVEKPGNVNDSPPKKKAFKVRSDLDWSSVSEEEMREFSDAFGGAKSPRNFDMDTVIMPGESVLAEVYESVPGEYVFTKLTPAVQTLADGTRTVEFAVDSFRISALGKEQRILAHCTVKIPSAGDNMVISIAENGHYDIALDAKFMGSSPEIHLKATGEYQKWEKSDLENMKRLLKP